MKNMFLIFAVLNAISFCFLSTKPMGIWYVGLGTVENKSSGYVGISIYDNNKQIIGKYNINPRTAISLQAGTLMPTRVMLFQDTKLNVVITGSLSHRFSTTGVIRENDLLKAGDILNFKVKKNFKLKIKIE